MRKIILFLTLFSFSYLSNAQICVGTPGELEWHAWNNLYDGEFSELRASPNFPETPDEVKSIFRLKSPTNYNNYFGSRVEGFISVPSASAVEFNVTGDKEVEFYFSTDSNPENKSLIAYIDRSIPEEDHDTLAFQTSAVFNLVPNEYYYFEIRHVDNWGSDRFSIWWKTAFLDPNEWRLISATYLNGIGCQAAACPPAGTPCDDGDPSTLNDIQDGNCNCFGATETQLSCVGERGKLTAYRYDNIPGSSLNDLYEAEQFPGMPATSETCETLSRESTNDYDQIGYAVQAYLTVPVSGNYKFNVTGDDNTILFLSSDSDPENRQAHQVLVSGHTGTTEHDKYIYQSTSNIYLEKGQYYYIELNQKDGGGSEHFSAFWQTPFTEQGQWKRIPALYFHDYACEVACIPLGTLCDDGDPYTNDDMYDANCECAGTPCNGLDCDSPLANYVPFEKCGLTTQLDNRVDNNWISCEKSQNPNVLRGETHWVMYDLGNRHELYQCQIWNYNVADSLSKGMTAVAIDYSLDGSNWLEYGSYVWSLASGDDGYGGFNGPNFNGLYAQYILITSLEGGNSCKGLGKVAFNAVVCPLSGTICDDQDDYTLDDKYDDNCECKGVRIDENDCGQNDVVLGDSLLYTNKYSAIETVNSVSHVAADSRVAFVGGKSITLDPGFETNGETMFLASIDPCNTPAMRALKKSRFEKLKEEEIKREIDKIAVLTVEKVTEDEVLVHYFIEKPGKASLSIKSIDGNLLFNLLDYEFVNPGLYRKRFKTSKLSTLNCLVEFNTTHRTLSKPIPKEAIQK